MSEPEVLDADAVEEDGFDPAALTPETVDLARYYTLDELAAMPAETLEELWLACPDRPFYEAALKAAVDDTFGSGAVATDLDRLAVIDECLLFYTGAHPDLDSPAPRIPTARGPDGGVQWFKVSDRIRARLAEGAPLDEERPAEGKQPFTLRRAAPLALLGLTVLCVGTLLIRSLAGGGQQISDVDAAATATADAQAALDAEATPTPLALDDIDRPIQAGDDLRDYYPVLLEIAPEAGLARVFPVQQRAVEVAEWGYASDPDVASAVLGLVVRPVLGIPYTPPNASFLDSLDEGDAIQLRMSTGQTLAFRVSGSQRVSRQEVSIFDQSQPGIVLALLADPAGDRLVVYGTYPAGQELEGGPSIQATGAVGEGVAADVADGLSITVLESYGSLGPAASPLDEGWAYLLVDLQVETTDAFDTGALAVGVVDPGGGRFTPLAADGSLTHYPPLEPVSLPPDGELRASVAFLVPRDLAAPTLRIAAGGDPAAYALDYRPPSAFNPSNLDVRVLEAVTEEIAGEAPALVLTVRLFDPYDAPITLAASDVFAIYSPSGEADAEAFPIGPAVQVAGDALPLTVEGGQAVDVEFRFPWDGEPLAGVQVGGAQFLLEID